MAMNSEDLSKIMYKHKVDYSLTPCVSLYISEKEYDK